MTIGGHLPLTTQRGKRTYVTTEKMVYQNYNYKGWTLQAEDRNKTAREDLNREATILRTQ